MRSIHMSRNLSRDLRFSLSDFSRMLDLHCPQSDEYASYTSRKSRPVSRTVTCQPTVARSLSAGIENAVGIQNNAVKEIERIRRNDRCECHQTPILAQASYSKCFSDQGREDTKQETITKARQPRYCPEKLWALSAKSAGLCQQKHDRCYEEAPEPAGTKGPDQKIRSDTWKDHNLVPVE